MQAYKYYYTVENNRILIELPKTFNHTSVEVIVLPVEKTKTKQKETPLNGDKSKQLVELLSIGVWSDSDLKPIQETSNLINKWNIAEF